MPTGLLSRVMLFQQPKCKWRADDKGITRIPKKFDDFETVCRQTHKLRTGARSNESVPKWYPYYSLPDWCRSFLETEHSDQLMQRTDSPSATPDAAQDQRWYEMTMMRHRWHHLIWWTWALMCSGIWQWNGNGRETATVLSWHGHDRTDFTSAKLWCRRENPNIYSWIWLS